LLRALDKHGQSIVLYSQSKQHIETMRDNSFYCPSCREKVMVKAGPRMLPHYAHQPGSKCSIAKGGEGPYHELGKLQLLSWLKQQGYDVYLESYISSIQQRPDILIKARRKRIAVEYQCCRISSEIIEKRTQGYLKEGMIPLWILGGNLLNRKKSHTLNISPFEQLFFHQFHDQYPPSLFFYCSNARQFAVFQNPYAISATKMLGSLTFLQSSQCNLSSLITPHMDITSSFLCTYWLREKQKLRQRPVSVSNSKNPKDLQFRQWLYINRLHPSTLPAYAHLPVQTQFSLASPPFVWQTRWLVDQLHPVQVGDCISISPKQLLSQQNSFPLIPYSFEPLEEYAQLLCSLGLLEYQKQGVYKKISEITIPTSVPEALRQDREVMERLSETLG